MRRGDCLVVALLLVSVLPAILLGTPSFALLQPQLYFASGKSTSACHSKSEKINTETNHHSMPTSLSSTPAKRKHGDVTDSDFGAAVAASKDPRTLRYLEFYAGIGGWRMALDEVLATQESETRLMVEAVAALEHSDLCLGVYHHNFPDGTTKPIKACRIEQISAAQLTDTWKADAWFLSPPCQPHTRQHDKQSADLQDPRSTSFLHLCSLLRDKDHLPSAALPSLICLENVVGFAGSNSCRMWRQALAQRGYAVAHFHWTPSQVGLPNDRPRYFCLAVLHDKLRTPSPQWEAIVTVEDEFEVPPVIQTSFCALGVVEESKVDVTKLPPLRDFLEPNESLRNTLVVPDKLLTRNASWCFDIVTPDTQRSACFTSGYGKFVKGTGSVLYQGPSLSNKEGPPTRDFALQRPEERTFEADWASTLEPGSLRYLSGIEIARLMGFPAHFSFPESCSAKQQWKLVGNSLNVRLAARLIRLGLVLTGKA